MGKRKKDFVAIHAAADFYEPRMATAFLDGVTKLRKKLRLLHLSSQIAHRSHVIIPHGDAEDAMDGVLLVTHNAFQRGREIGKQKLDEVLGG